MRKPVGARGLETEDFNVKYWKAFLDTIDKDIKVGINPRKVAWIGFSEGTDYQFQVGIAPRKKKIYVKLALRTPPSSKKAPNGYNCILENYAFSLEKQGAENLGKWREAKGSRSISLERPDCDSFEEIHWEDQHKWLKDNLYRFREVFISLIEAQKKEFEGDTLHP